VGSAVGAIEAIGLGEGASVGTSTVTTLVMVIAGLGAGGAAQLVSNPTMTIRKNKSFIRVSL
jgi:hypothetical protein